MKISMNKFDREERLIHAAFLRIYVDPNGPAAHVKSRIQKETLTHGVRVRHGIPFTTATALALVCPARRPSLSVLSRPSWLSPKSKASA